MKKLFLVALASSASLWAMAAGERQGTIVSDPSPAISNKPVTVTITTDDLGSDVYTHTWAVVGSEDKPVSDWASGLSNPKLKMTGSAGKYSITISDIQSFYGLTDAEMESCTKLGFIARTASAQTIDLFITVEQGRRTVYSGGEGTQASPFLISTADDLIALAGYSRDWTSDIYFKQTANIALSNFNTPIGSLGSPYKGHYDGDGYAITGVRLDNETLGQAVGLFGAIDGAEISRLAVTDASAKGQTYVGILVGYANSGKISECYVDGTVTGKSLAVGGLVGLNAGATITDCYSLANVTADDQYAVGGLVGKNLGTVKNTYATGTVAGKNYIGGIVGANYGTISSSAAVNAKISSANDYVARFGGNNNSENSSDNNVAWDGIPASSSWTQHGDHALNSAIDLKSKAAYETSLGWDFSDVWKWETKAGHSYPVLACMKGDQKDPFPLGFYSGAIENIGADSPLAGLQVWPNPAVDFVNVQAGAPIADITVVSLSGAKVLSAAPGEADTTIGVSSLAPGVYLMRVATADGEAVTVKLIKK